MKFQALTISILILLSNCGHKEKKTVMQKEATRFFVGTYTHGKSEGIYAYLLRKDGTLSLNGLAAKAVNPSYLAKSNKGKFLLAVNEVNNKDSVGFVSSFLITKDSLLAVSKNSSGGADPCFVAVNDDGYVLVANYTGGNIGLLKLNGKGQLSGLLDVEQHNGKGSTERQKGPHAHSAWFETDTTIISVDLGTNELWFSKIDTTARKLQPLNPNRLKMETGAGPRHLTFHPNKKWIYVINELNGTITQLQKKPQETYAIVNTVTTLPKGYTGINTCADIHISSDGKFVYASNRGHNSIAIYKVTQENGFLQLIAFEPTRGDGPRNFALSPDENYLLVANQNTNTIVSFKRNKVTGLLEFFDEIEAPSPVCILF